MRIGFMMLLPSQIQTPADAGKLTGEFCSLYSTILGNGFLFPSSQRIDFCVEGMKTCAAGLIWRAVTNIGSAVEWEVL
jgi:hypothetical protein